MLCGICRVLGTFVVSSGEDHARRASDLFRLDFAGRSALIQWQGQPLDPAAAGARRTFFHRCGMERHSLSGWDNYRTFSRPNSLRAFPGAFGGLRICHAYSRGGVGLYVSHQDPAASASAGTDDDKDSLRRTALYLAGETNPGGDLA